MANTFSVRVPGTTANCGPGFDTLGIACTIYNELDLTLSATGELAIVNQGEGAADLTTDESNIVFQAVKMVYDTVGKTLPGFRLTLRNAIPLARGLGSSAAAIVGGLVAANASLNSPLSNQKLLELATRMEGHPDNVAPALFGGITVSTLEEDGTISALHFLPAKPLFLAVAVPAFELSTRKARAVMPSEVSMKDALFNVSHSSLLAAALCSGQYQYLPLALQDRLHQPYRSQLIPAMEAVFAAAISAGALGAVISGAGPTLLAFCDRFDAAIADAMVTAFSKAGIAAQAHILEIDARGAQVI
ncbi:homoserine kinase [Azotosporobacter soli]|uniref:homoserine kinase n=1 Tax=Azotosporobacter soli TaxID=3055040 RepID=UPI0031FE44E5